MKFDEVKKGINLLELLSKNKVLSSKSEARRVILNNGIKLNNLIMKDIKKEIKFSNFDKNILKISYGKKKHYIVKII